MNQPQILRETHTCTAFQHLADPFRGRWFANIGLVLRLVGLRAWGRLQLMYGSEALILPCREIESLDGGPDALPV